MDKVELEFEFALNSPEAKAEAEQVKKAITGVGDTAEQQAKRVQANVQKMVNPAGNKSQFNLQTKLEEAKNASFTEKNTAKLLDYNRTIQRTEQDINRLKNAGKTGFDELGNAVGKTTNVAGKAFNGLKLIANILPGLGIAGLLGFAVGPILDYISKLDIFRNKANDAKVAQEDVAKALAGTEYAKAVTNVNELTINIDLAKRGLISKESVLKQYNGTIGKTTGEVKTLDQAEKELAENAENFIKVTLLKAAAQVALESAAKSAYEAEISRRKKLEEFSSINDNFGQGNLEGINTITGEVDEKVRAKRAKQIAKNRADERAKEAKALQDSADQQKSIAKKFFSDAAEISKKNGYKNFLGNDDKAKNKDARKIEINEAENFSKKLTDIHNASFRKTLSNDEAEVQAIKDKYAKFKEEADKFYKAEPNGQAKINGKNVSKSQVYGILKADEKAENTALLEKRAKEIADKEDKLTKERTDKLLADFMSYGDKKKKLETDLERDLALIGDKPEVKANRIKKYDEQLAELVESNSQKLEEYQVLFEGIEKLSRKEALLVLDKARTKLAESVANGSVPEELAKKVEALFDKVNKSVQKGTKDSSQELIQLANDIDGLVSSVGGVDTAFGKLLSTVSNVVGQVGNIKKGFGDLKIAQGKGERGMADFSSLGQLGAGLGIVGAGFSIFQSVAKLFDKSAEREEQASYARDLQNKQTESLNKALERQVALLDQVYGTEKVKKYAEAIKQATDNQAKYAQQLAGKFQLNGDKNFDELVAKINNGEKLSYDERTAKGYYERRGAFKGLPTDLASLQTLLEEGSLDATTGVIVQNLIKAKETADQLINSLRAENVGSTLGQLADDFIATLTDGTQDFGKTFEETIQKSILNGFRGKLIQEQLQAFYTQFADLSKGGLTKDEIETLRQTYIDASQNAKTDLEALSQATGVKLGASPDDKDKESNSVLSGIKGMSQQTAEVIAGQFGGQRIATLEGNEIARANGATAMDQLAQMKSTALIIIKIEDNTRRSAEAEESYLPYLKSIDNKLSNDNNKFRATGNG